MKRFRALLVLTLFAVVPARAFVANTDPLGNHQRWNLATPSVGVSTNVVNTNTLAIRFFLAADAYSTTNTEAELNAVRASFGQWQSIPGTSLKFEDAGLIAAGVDVNTSDGTNVVFWVKNGDGTVNGGHDNIFSALGVTFTSFNADNNQLTEADIVFNASTVWGYTWFTGLDDTNNPGIFIEGVALHEIGHFIGLNHSPVGGATMMWRTDSGVTSWAGLSPDEIAAARFLYPPASPPIDLGRLRGHVMTNGVGVFGAVVVVEDASGNVVGGTVSGGQGAYELPMLQAGTYGVRITPLDPNAAYTLIRGRDISLATNGHGGYQYDAVATDFLPTTNTTVTVLGGKTAELDFAVIPGPPAFRISHILASGGTRPIALPVTLRPGQSNVLVGVLSPTAPASGLTLTVTGDGVSVGATSENTTSYPGSGFTQIAATIGVASNATPGLRSFVIQKNGTNVAYANGFLEILPLVRDDNFDGLDDLFQRQYFPLFTAPEAGPGADPVGDGLINLAEFIAGTSPSVAGSLLKIQSVVQNGNGSTITWQSVAGKKYQVFSRADFSGATWQQVGTTVLAIGASTSFLDATATSGIRFYRVQVLP